MQLRVSQFLRSVPVTSRQARVGLALLALLVVTVATLTPTEVDLDGHGYTPGCIFCGPNAGVDALANVVLFIPLGAAFVIAGMRPFWAIVIVALTTLSIELAQFTFVAGRDTSIGDVAMNLLGGLIGIVGVQYIRTLIAPGARAAALLAAAGAAGCIAVLATTAWLLGPSLPGPPWYSARLPGADLSDSGWVVGGEIGGQVLADTLVRDAESARRTLLSGGAAAVTVVVPLDHDQTINLLQVADGASDDIVVLSRDDGHVAFFLRMRANDVRLRRIAVRLRGFFNPTLGDTVRVSGAREGGRLVVAGEHDGQVQQRSLDLTPSLGWAFFAPIKPPLRRWAPAANVLWVMMLLFPFAYWAACAARSDGARPVYWHGARGVVAFAGLVLIPRAFSLPVSPWPEWTGAAVAFALATLACNFIYRSGLADYHAAPDVVPIDALREATRFT